MSRQEFTYFLDRSYEFFKMSRSYETVDHLQLPMSVGAMSENEESLRSLKIYKVIYFPSFLNTSSVFVRQGFLDFC